jgi:dihydroxy-acid dehydratase
MVVGHVAPEAAVGGVIAVVDEGDLITVDADRGVLQLNLSGEEIKNRLEEWIPVTGSRRLAGVLAKYAKLVSSASTGAVTDYTVLGAGSV